MRVCAKCKKSYPDDAEFCVKDGTRLDEDDDVLFGDDPKSDPSGPHDKKTGIGPGSIVGNYKVMSVLGKGGMGIVYLAEHPRLGRRVAIKVLRPEFASDTVLVQRFFDEARAANQVGHENIVEVFDFVDSGHHRYYVMELLEGEPLSAAMEGETPLPLARTYRIALQVADALAAVHDKGIVHRDLKPDNIFLTKRTRRGDFVKVLDFGVAKLLDRDPGEGHQQTQTGMIVGTPAYMSPEQLKAEKIDRRADIYAFGVILFQMVTGVRPFRAKSIPELMMLHCSAPPPRPSAAKNLPAPVPMGLEALILRCLEKNPDDRPATMHEVESELEALSDGVLEGSGPTPRPSTKPGLAALGSGTPRPATRPSFAVATPAPASSPFASALSGGPSSALNEVTRKAYVPTLDVASVAPNDAPTAVRTFDAPSDAPNDAPTAVRNVESTQPVEPVTLDADSGMAADSGGVAEGASHSTPTPSTRPGLDGIAPPHGSPGSIKPSMSPGQTRAPLGNALDVMPDVPDVLSDLDAIEAPPRSRAPLFIAAAAIVALGTVAALTLFSDNEDTTTATVAPPDDAPAAPGAASDPAPTAAIPAHVAAPVAEAPVAAPVAEAPVAAAPVAPDPVAAAPVAASEEKPVDAPSPPVETATAPPDVVKPVATPAVDKPRDKKSKPRNDKPAPKKTQPKPSTPGELVDPFAT